MLIYKFNICEYGVAYFNRRIKSIILNVSKIGTHAECITAEGENIETTLLEFLDKLNENMLKRKSFISKYL